MEGGFTDDDGNICLGVWADEGGVLLVLQRQRYSVSFHAMQLDGEPQHGPATVSSFRYERIRQFLLDAEQANPYMGNAHRQAIPDA